MCFPQFHVSLILLFIDSSCVHVLSLRMAFFRKNRTGEKVSSTFHFEMKVEKEKSPIINYSMYVERGLYSIDDGEFKGS